MVYFELAIILWSALSVYCQQSQVYGNASMDATVKTSVNLADIMNDRKIQASSRVVKMIGHINYRGLITPTGPLCTKAMELALDRLHSLKRSEKSPWLDGYELQVDMVDEECDDGLAIQRTVKELVWPTNDRIPFLFMGWCVPLGQGSIAQAMKQLGYYGVTQYISTSDSLKNRQRYNAIFPLVKTVLGVYEALAEFSAKAGWFKIAILAEDYPFFNEAEKDLVSYFNEKGIKILWYGKVSSATNNAEMADAIRTMRTFEPRVILSNSNNAVSVSCWLHRFGIHGPNYVVLATEWSNYDPATVRIPDHASAWCTRTMLKESDIFGPMYQDSTGLNASEFVKGMEAKVYNAQRVSGWSTFPTVCYDIMLFLGYALHETELLLRQTLNSTLSEWTVGSRNFRENSRLFGELAKRAFYRTAINGTKGFYYFDERTTLNTKGYNLIAFRQSQYLTLARDTLIRTPMAHYRGSDRTVYYINGGPRWRTETGKPPGDTVRVVEVATLGITAESYWLLLAFSLIGIVIAAGVITCNFFAALLPDWLAARINTNRDLFCENAIILVGNIFMLFYPIIALPPSERGDVSQIIEHCSAAAFLLEIGYSMVSLGFFAKLDQGRYYLAVKTENISQAVPRRFASLFYYVAPCLVIHTGLISALLATSGLSQAERVEMPRHYSTDASIAYVPFRYECRIAIGSGTTIGLLIAMAALHAIAIPIICFMAYQVRMESKTALSAFRKKASRSVVWTIKELQSTVNCFYYAVLIIVAAILIVLTQSGNGDSLQVTVSALVIAFAYANMLATHLPKTLNVKKVRAPRDTLAASAERGSSSARISGALGSGSASNSHANLGIIPSIRLSGE